MASILAIRLGALGDMMLVMRAFRAIRAYHTTDRLLLLTEPAYEAFALSTNLFDEIFLTKRDSGVRGLCDLLQLVNKLKRVGLTRVYDFQQNDRTTLLYYLLRLLYGRGLEWNGSPWGCSHRIDNRAAHRRYAHAYERHEDQLRQAGITDFPNIDLDFITGAHRKSFGLAAPYVLLVPGAAPDRPAKRWPAGCYGVLAAQLAAQGIMPVALGSAHEAEVIAEMIRFCPDLVDLSGRTTISDLAGLARDAEFVLGNDTGPMHVMAPGGCRLLVLYSNASDPHRTVPWGPDFRPVPTLQVANLAELSPGDVMLRLVQLGYLRHNSTV